MASSSIFKTISYKHKQIVCDHPDRCFNYNYRMVDWVVLRSVTTWNLVTFTVKLSSDNYLLIQALPEIWEKIEKYGKKKVLNADEFGLLYRQLSGCYLSQKYATGFEKDKRRINLQWCINFDGSGISTLMIIGNSERPRAFKKVRRWARVLVPLEKEGLDEPKFSFCLVWSNELLR